MAITITLRPYQTECIDAVMAAMDLPGNDLVALPTGAGKSIVIAEVGRRLGEDVLICQPSREILQQNRDKLKLYVPEWQIGTYSASMNEKTISRFTFATIQSIYKHPHKFRHFRKVLIDEAHLVHQKNESGMFTQFLKAIGDPKVVGFTAT